jgi:hypothetical protein
MRETTTTNELLYNFVAALAVIAVCTMVGGFVAMMHGWS